MPENCDCGNSDDRSERDVQPVGAPTSAPSTKTRTMPPPGGSARRAPGDSTHPKLPMTPDTVAPWAGVSMAPNGATDPALLHVIVLVPSAVTCPSASLANAEIANVPLPRFGRKLVS